MATQVQRLQQQRQQQLKLQRDTQRRQQQEILRRGSEFIQKQQTQQQAQQIKEAKEKSAKINAELSSFEEKANYENYEKEYEKLSPEARKLVTPPSKIKETPQYKEYQASVKKYEEAKAAQQAEAKRISEYNSAVKVLKKLIVRGDWYIIVMKARYGSGAMRKLAKEAIEMKKLARKAELKEQEVKQTISQSVPTSTFSLGVKPIYTNGKLVGIDDPIQKMCRLPTPAEELMYGQKVTPISSAKSSLFISTRDLPRTIKLKEVPTMGDINIFGTSIEVSELRDTMRTTGSPIRVTKLTGLKSRGYIPDRRPKPRITIKPKQIVKTPSFFKKDKKVSTKKSKFDDDFFFGKKIKKKFKKRNIWGF
jgi:chemotaxis protein histidine kinase CheA